MLPASRQSGKLLHNQERKGMSTPKPSTQPVLQNDFQILIFSPFLLILLGSKFRGEVNDSENFSSHLNYVEIITVF